jgi:hypothetical protein
VVSAVPQLQTAVVVGAAGVAAASALAVGVVAGVKFAQKWRRRNQAARESSAGPRDDEQETTPTTDVFVSYTHADKTIARRVAHRLRALGLSVFLDEDELRPGDRLTPTVEAHIRASQAVLAVATKAAAKSAWVRKEVAFAESQASPIPIYSLFVEHIEKALPFKEDLGVDATDRHVLEKRIIELAQTLAGAPLPPPSAEALLAGLEALESEEPTLSPLIRSCLAGGGLAHAGVENAVQASKKKPHQIHALDFALNALYDSATDEKQRQLVAAHAALFFRRSGAGAYALEQYLRPRCASDTTLCEAVRTRLNADELGTALDLLNLTDSRDDQALSSFLASNGYALSPAQRAVVVRLVTWPERGPMAFAQDAAFQALRYLRNNEDLRELWQRWIRTGQFDGGECRATPTELAAHLRRGLEKRDWVVQELLGHVRWLARSTERGKVEAAVNHVKAVADRRSPLLNRVVQECSLPWGATWDNWEHAQEMSLYIRCFVEAALSDRDWGRALERYERGWAAKEHVDALLASTRA